MSALALLVVASCVAGAVLAGVLLPVVGGLGLGAKSAADAFESLPAELTIPSFAQRTRIVDSQGRQIASFYYENRVIVPLEQIPLVARQAIIAIEDSRFYENEGIDLKGTLRAAITNAGSGDVRQGGSTLTQQLVKNVLVQSARTDAERRAATADTLSRKVREARYALALSRRLSKDQILEKYLNIVYFGEGTYGIAAAARHYFGVPVQKLTLPQAAMLAGLVRNPTGYDPQLHPKAAKNRRDTVIARMEQLGYISSAVARHAEAAKNTLHVTRAGNGCEESTAPFFCDYVVRAFLDDAHLGRTVDDRRKLLLNGGLTIETTLDATTEHAAEQAALQNIPRTSRVATAAVTVRPGTGEVLAMAVNRTYGHSKKPGVTSVNYALGGSSGFQAGSTFKVFLLAEALQQGAPLSLTFNAPNQYASKKFNDYKNGQIVPYTIHNAGDSEAGVFNLPEATWLSVNTYFIQLEEKYGIEGAVKIAEDMGVRRFPGKPLHAVPSFFLGTNDVTPLEMAGAYAAFAAHGKYCAPHPIARVVDAHGKVLEKVAPQCRQAVDPSVADGVTAILRGVVDGPNPYRTGINASIGRPVAGKTGTTNDEQEAWFCGYTPDLATAVWVGDPRGPQYPLHDVDGAGRHFSVVYGGDLPALIWHQLMSTALAGTPVHDFNVPLAQAPVAPPAPKPSPKPSPQPTPKPTTSAGKPTPPPPPAPTPTKTKKKKP